MSSRTTSITANEPGIFSSGILRIVAPVALTIVMFTASLFAFIMPQIERSMWERKQEAIRELTNSAWALLDYYHRLESSGAMSASEAKKAATLLVREMRYGDEMKDYYWINDMTPVMIVHPYRPDLDGANPTDFTDPAGKRLFVEMVQVVAADGEGYVDYMWQWKDDPGRIVPKLSFVKLFEPWGWVVGTGLYVDDVHDSIVRFQRRLALISISVLLIISLLLGYVVQQNIRMNRDRYHAVSSLQRSEERFRELVDLLPEIVFEFDNDGVLTFANKQSYEITGYTVKEYAKGFKAIDFVAPEDRERCLANMQRILNGEYPGVSEYRAIRKDGSTFTVMINSAPVIRDGKIAGIRGIIIDITEQKKVEAELRESEEKYRQLFEMESDAIFLVDAQTGGIIDVNHAALDLYGYRRNELVTRNYSTVAHESNESVASLVRHHGRMPLIFHRKKDGTVFPVEISIRGFILQGRDVNVLAVRDNTDRFNARRELEHQREYFKSIIDNAPNCIYVKNRNGGIVLANRMYTDLFGETSDAGIHGGSAQLHVDSPFAESMLADDDDIFSRRTNRVVREHVAVDSKGEHRWFYTIKVPLSGSDGEVEQLLAISSDITLLKKTEDALRKSEESFRAVFETAGDSIYIKDFDLRYTNINPAMERVFGISSSGIVGSNTVTADLFDNGGDTSVLDSDRLVLAGETVQEERSREIDGTLRTFNIIKVPMRNSLGEIIGLCGIARDITERKRLESQFYQAQKMESIGRLAGGIAHDFNNLLTVIMGNTDLAMMSDNLDPQLHADITEIKTNAERAANLTRQLLAFSRRQIIKPRIIDINKVVLDMDKMLRRLIGEQIELVTLLNDGLWNVNVDPHQIEQILTNLVVNSRDAMTLGKGKITVETANVNLDDNYTRTHNGVVPGDYTMLAVSDNGIGMDAEIQSHLFEPFFTTKEKDKGTGLGLATCYGIVKQNNGGIWVYSEAGRGTTVKVYLPRAEGVPETVTAADTLSALSGGSETILIVEDEHAVHEMIVKVLKSKGYTIFGASNGEEALRFFERNENGGIDLMITDVVMPHMGGIELVERLFAQYGSMKVLYMSGYTDTTIVNHGILKPGVEFLQKPFTPGSLIRKVRQVLDK